MFYVDLGIYCLLWTGDKLTKVAAVASDGEFWISKVLSTIEELENDKKHAAILTKVDEEDVTLHAHARDTILKLRKVGSIYCPVCMLLTEFRYRMTNKNLLKAQNSFCWVLSSNDIALMVKMRVWTTMH